MISASQPQHQFLPIQSGYPPFYPARLVTRLSPEIVKYMMTALMMEIQNPQLMQGRPLRVLAFNELAANGYNNQYFNNLLQVGVSLLEMSLPQFNNDVNAALTKLPTAIVANYLGKLYYQYTGLVSIPDPAILNTVNTASATWQQMTQQVNNYLSQQGGMPQQPHAYNAPVANQHQANANFNAALAQSGGYANAAMTPSYAAPHVQAQQATSFVSESFGSDSYTAAPITACGGNRSKISTAGGATRVTNTSNMADPFASSWGNEVVIDVVEPVTYVEPTVEEEVMPEKPVSNIEVASAAQLSALFKLKSVIEYDGGLIMLEHIDPQSCPEIRNTRQRIVTFKSNTDGRLTWPYVGGLRMVSFAYNPSRFAMQAVPTTGADDIPLGIMQRIVPLKKEEHVIPAWIDEDYAKMHMQHLVADEEAPEPVTENTEVTFGVKEMVLFENSLDTAWANINISANDAHNADKMLYMRKVSIAKPVYLRTVAEHKFIAEIQSAYNFHDVSLALNKAKGSVAADIYKFVNDKITEVFNSFIRNRMSIAKARVDSFDEDWTAMQQSLQNRYNGPVTIALRARRRDDMQSLFGPSTKEQDDIYNNTIALLRDSFIDDDADEETKNSLQFLVTRHLLCHLKVDSTQLGIELHEHLPSLVSGSYGDGFMHSVIEIINTYITEGGIPDGTRILLKTSDGVTLELHQAALLDIKFGRQLLVTKVV